MPTFERGELSLYYEISGHRVIEEGRVVGYRGLAWDVTEREALIAKISDSEARFRALTELSSDWYWEMDEELRFTLLKRGARDTLMLADEDVLGKHQWETRCAATSTGFGRGRRPSTPRYWGATWTRSGP